MATAICRRVSPADDRNVVVGCLFGIGGAGCEAETNMIGRILSATVALTYLIIAFTIEGPIGVVKIAIFMLLPLVLIWFPEEMGSFTGVIRGQYINTETPGCLVAFGGWLVLLLPVWAPMVAALFQRFLM
jgi:hypothetical protein